MAFEDLGKTILPYLRKYDAFIGVAGIRYGSVAYIAFGNGVSTLHKNHSPTMTYPVEMEFGADYWELLKGDEVLMDSNFSDVEAARTKISSFLIGRRVLGVETEGVESRLELDADTSLRSRVVQEPASGFLYSFHVARGPTWETVDGISTIQ